MQVGKLKRLVIDEQENTALRRKQRVESGPGSHLNSYLRLVLEMTFHWPTARSARSASSMKAAISPKCMRNTASASFLSRPDTFQNACAVTVPIAVKTPSMPAPSQTQRPIRTSTEPMSSTTRVPPESRRATPRVRLGTACVCGAGTATQSPRTEYRGNCAKSGIQQLEPPFVRLRSSGRLLARDISPHALLACSNGLSEPTYTRPVLSRATGDPRAIDAHTRPPADGESSSRRPVLQALAK
jgi:hypothetical protein